MSNFSNSENEPQQLREQMIHRLAKATDATDVARQIADDLFSLDLTVYSSDFTLKSVIYNSLSTSTVDPSISLHPDQLDIIARITDHDALIVSAPTSFGKTFCIFEYIALYQPTNVVLVVPTLALVEEYLKKIVKRFASKFSAYLVHTNLEPEKNYDFTRQNLFILTHDRIIQADALATIKHVDFLVIDEVYKLETDKSNDRVLVLNMAYHHLSKIAKKYVLLAPFLGGIKDLTALEKKPVFYHSNFSPVVNEIHVHKILREEDREAECHKLIQSIPSSENTLIYFPTVTKMNKYIRNQIATLPDASEINESSRRFISWAKEEIHEEWSVVKAMEKGYLVHNGQIPRGTRQFQLDQYENSSGFNKLLCTATLLEGVNTSARNIIITKAARGASSKATEDFSAFDFFNLVGRTGRLNQHLIGTAYYIKGPQDPEYRKEDAIRTIRFELTDDSLDIDMQTANLENRPEVVEFLASLGISLDDYVSNIGSRYRFETVRNLYLAYLEKKDELLRLVDEYTRDGRKGRFYLVQMIMSICTPSFSRFEASITTDLLNINRKKLSAVINHAAKYFPDSSIDRTIATTIRLKYSYIEHELYGKTNIVRYFMEIDRVPDQYIDVISEKIIHPIDVLYFTTSPGKKMMADLGIYERDIGKLSKIIGEDFRDSRHLIEAIKASRSRLNSLSYMSLYVIDSLISQ